ncbi:carbamate kinase [Lipingzhangella sp. LS1_29]|uniref:Carbamate kinase n=1 Tax=Lipingzhangella rawalii TaxID=2055835 RepID=A0ABU2H6S2_9ACTN|nr:carbamate kinase [Lipingzhangella rawalii]MDS1270549.1 carbamate kinase [Lipingzhangella rawalii]
MTESHRVVVALGGNAMTAPDGQARPEDQRKAIAAAVEPIAEVISGGTEVVLTHGNGPQVGNLLVKNEIAADVVPPVPLDWCGAQTQATIGYTLSGALEDALARRGVRRSVAALVTRVRVDAEDAAFQNPDKPIGRYVEAGEAARHSARGQHWVEVAGRGWRRVVPSPEPQDILDAGAVRALLAAGIVPVAAGGGGIPVAFGADGSGVGVEAVLDKDRTAALLARVVNADTLVIATDVPGAVIHRGSPQEQQIGHTTPEQLREYARAGHFDAGSMGPKVQAADRFVSHGGQRAVITSLDQLAAGLAGTAGTIVS